MVEPKLPKAGEWITCKSGHRHYKVLRDQFPGSMMLSEDVLTPLGEHPQPSSRVTAVCWCGESLWSDKDHRPYCDDTP